MIELTDEEVLSKATERARASKLLVQVVQWRQYRVTNRENGKRYVVDFFLRNGRRFGHCTCEAGMNNMACKHLSAAVARRIMIATEKRDALPQVA